MECKEERRNSETQLTYTHSHTPEVAFMVRKDGAEARKARIQKIAQAIHAALEENNGKIPLRKTIAGIAIQTGLTTERIMEYLTLLMEACHFILDVEKDRIEKYRVEKDSVTKSLES